MRAKGAAAYAGKRATTAGYSQYGPLKKDAGDAVIAVVEPVRSRYHELMDDRGELARLLRIGNDRARNVAAATLARAHRAVGLMPRV